MRLETERLVLRQYEESDLLDYFHLLSDRENLYFLDDIVMNTMDEARQSLHEAIALMKSGNARRFAVTLRGDTRLIGGVGYDIAAKTPIGRVGHMGWFILPEHQNKGYITEAARRVLTYAFENDNCIRITTGCYRDNAPTQRVINKLGFRQEAEKIKSKWHDGEMKDRLEYGMNAP